ncbi:hypothetical protein KC333_g119 [Hortaea werneckii]|nr:hypothetical protein KC333_g119 [Hortaea werneckii]
MIEILGQGVATAAVREWCLLRTERRLRAVASSVRIQQLALSQTGSSRRKTPLIWFKKGNFLHASHSLSTESTGSGRRSKVSVCCVEEGILGRYSHPARLSSALQNSDDRPIVAKLDDKKSRYVVLAKAGVNKNVRTSKAETRIESHSRTTANVKVALLIDQQLAHFLRLLLNTILDIPLLGLVVRT